MKKRLLDLEPDRDNHHSKHQAGKRIHESFRQYTTSFLRDIPVEWFQGKYGTHRSNHLLQGFLTLTMALAKILHAGIGRFCISVMIFTGDGGFWGYGYQWWVPDDSGAYAAVGIYNQFVYVNPKLQLVIAKTSANHTYGMQDNESSDREDEHLAFFKAIERALD